jgi:CRISPR-associated protein Cas2
MVVMILERVPGRLKGELTRWLFEPKGGIFIGNCSAMVRDKLWEMARKDAEDGSGLLIHSANTEQGFDVRMFGVPSRDIIDQEGLRLVCTREKPD